MFCRWLACLNPHSYAVGLDDLPFARALRAADWLIPDGAGIVLASQLLGGRIRERVTGSDINPAVIRVMAGPRKCTGTSATTMRSRNAANRIITSEKPTAAPKP